MKETDYKVNDIVNITGGVYGSWEDLGFPLDITLPVKAKIIYADTYAAELKVEVFGRYINNSNIPFTREYADLTKEEIVQRFYRHKSEDILYYVTDFGESGGLHNVYVFTPDGLPANSEVYYQYKYTAIVFTEEVRPLYKNEQYKVVRV